MKNLKKLIFIGILMLFLLIPLMLTLGKISERSSYRHTAKADITQLWTGAQQVTGPFLLQPYREKSIQRSWDENLKQYVERVVYLDKELLIAPQILSTNTRMKTSLRRRGIYQVPVYTGKIEFQGSFDSTDLESLKKRPQFYQLKKPYLIVHIRDIRGIDALSDLTWGDEQLSFHPGVIHPNLGSGVHIPFSNVDIKPQDFKFSLNLRGMDSLEFTPTGNATMAHLEADWPHPKFFGRYLPSDYTITDTQFSANWQLSHFASNIKSNLDECLTDNCYSLLNNTFGTSLIQPVDIYSQSERAVKYALLFIGIAFAGFYLLEVLKSIRIHPIQYMLVGISMAVFYILLIALAEYIPFIWAYSSAAIACVSLTGVYVSFVLKRKSFGMQFSGGMLFVYFILYFIISSEDYALLTGSLLIFSVLSIILISTRHVDWYQSDELKRIKKTAT